MPKVVRMSDITVAEFLRLGYLFIVAYIIRVLRCVEKFLLENLFLCLFAHNNSSLAIFTVFSRVSSISELRIIISDFET